MKMKGGIFINLVIATHGQMASGIKNTLEVLTDRKEIYVLDAYVKEDDIESQMELLKMWLKERKDGMTLIFTDLLAGSVNQRMTREFLRDKVYIITGFNLALLLECLMMDEETITRQSILQAIERAKDEIVFVNELLNKEEETTC